MRFGPLLTQDRATAESSKTAAISTKARLLRLSGHDGQMVADYVRADLAQMARQIFGAAAAQALVLNIGTLTADKVQAMLLAQKQAHSRAIPVVLDPVGAGATPYRNQALSEIIQSGPPGIIRGNGSEIMSVAGLSVTTKGVDSVMASDQSLDAALALAKRIEGVVCVSGETDYIIDAHGQVALLRNGDVWMTKVTGVGCSATALIGAFAAVQFDAWRATTAAMAYWGVVGEVAAEQTRALGAGVGTYATKLLDVTHNLDEQTFVQRLNISFNRMEA